jgi:hypothetical protein
MSTETVLEAAVKLAVDDGVLIAKVISIRYIAIEQRLTYEPAEGGEWVVLLEERSPFGDKYGTEECMVIVEDLTGEGRFETTL